MGRVIVGPVFVVWLYCASIPRRGDACVRREPSTAQGARPRWCALVMAKPMQRWAPQHDQLAQGAEMPPAGMLAKWCGGWHTGPPRRTQVSSGRVRLLHARPGQVSSYVMRCYIRLQVRPCPVGSGRDRPRLARPASGRPVRADSGQASHENLGKVGSCQVMSGHLQ